MGHGIPGRLNCNRADRDDGQLSKELSRRLPIIVSGAEGNCGLVTGARLFGDFRKSDVVGRVKSG